MKWLDRLFGGPKDMAALPAGTKAPEFSLPAAVDGRVDGKEGGKFSLQSALKQGPVLAAFFKVSCPVCQYTFPFLERIHKAHRDKKNTDKKITIVGISQNGQRDTSAFLKEYGVTFPTLLDDPNGYAVSNAYGLTNVPTLFLIGQDGKIEISSVGWVKQEVEDINRKLAAAQQTALPPIFQPGEDVSDFRAG
ncbi:MAG: TlpA disulfide reductase family protein [Terriglobales bacterium]|jgi:peroxiredoxin